MNKNRLIVRALALLGFGAAVGLGSGCASRAQKSSTPPDVPILDTTVARVMYGVTPVRYIPDKPMREKAGVEHTESAAAGFRSEKGFTEVPVNF